MLFHKITWIFALLTFVSATDTFCYGTPAVEYEVRIQNFSARQTTDIKNTYEKAAAAQAYARITAAVEKTGIAEACLNSTNTTIATVPETDGNIAGPDMRTAVYSLKDCIVTTTGDSEIFLSMLASDIDSADRFWKTIVSESSANMSDWKPARAKVRAYFNGSLTAIKFAGWTLSPYADAANLNANPEHYIKITETNATDTKAGILEGWGGVLSRFGMARTHFMIPQYAQPKFDGSDYPASWAIGPEFLAPLQRAGEKVLASDGTVFGVLHIAARDLSPVEVLDGMGGIEIYSAVWYPAWENASVRGTKDYDNYLKDEAEHMVVEIVNLTLKAREDLGL